MSRSLSRRRFLSASGKTVFALGAAGGSAGAFLAACSSGGSTGSATEVSYTYPTFAPVPDVKLVQDAMNKILLDKYNVTIKLGHYLWSTADAP